MTAADFTIGVEEEYQLVDRASRAAAARVDDVFPAAIARVGNDHVSHELKQTQIEVGTPVRTTLGEVRAELARLRTEVGAAANDCGLAIVAAGSHPTAPLVANDFVDDPHYRELVARYAHLAQELVVFGCHVHVGVVDKEEAIAALNFVRPWLPVLLAVSTSSPFWDGGDTGYASYRSEVFGRLPTAGLPEPFSSRAEFDEVVAQLLATDTIDAPTSVHWDARPSARYETVEIRIADMCTSLDDAVLLAGLAGALVREGVTACRSGRQVLAVRPEIVRAARWRAARYGLTGDLIDVIDICTRPAGDVVARLLELLTPALDRWGELDHMSGLVDQVLQRGTSAQRQRAVFDEKQSLTDVIDWLVDETAAT